MDIDLTVFVILFLAASGLVDLWFEGSIFSSIRDILEDKVKNAGIPDSEGVASPLWSTHSDAVETWTPYPPFLLQLGKVTPLWAAELLSCRFCFSHHASWIVLALYTLGTLPEIHPTVRWFLHLPVYTLALTYAGNLVRNRKHASNL